MDFAAHGATLSLAWFIAVNVAVSVLVACLARPIIQRGALERPGGWLLLRLAPAAASALFVLVLFVPSYWQYEPRESVEGFDLTLTTIAVAGVALIAASAIRGLLAWRSAARRVHRWVEHARPISAAGAMAGAPPVFVVDSDQPVIALSGVYRHRLLVTRGLVDALTSTELEVVIAHELGHRRACDNLKRLAMRAAPDLLRFTRIARDLEQRWAAAAEHLADSAAGTGAGARCALASALVKVARLRTGGASVMDAAPLTEPISTLIGGGDITARVQRLLDDRQPARPGVSAGLAGLVALAAVIAIAYSPLLRAIHDTTERLIRILP